MKYIAGLIVGMMVLASIAGTVSGADEEDTCAVLFDFGNGRVMWADVPVTEGMNAFNVTVEAANMLGLDLHYTEYDFGNFIDSIGGVGVPGNFDVTWNLWLWDSASSAWKESLDGASTISADDFKALSWRYDAWGGPTPLATQDHRYPWTSFRHDPMNAGMQEMGSIKLSDLNWSKELENGFISSSVVGANGLVYVFDGGDMFADDANSTLFCLDIAGNIVWQEKIGKSTYQITSPLLYEDMVIISTADGYVLAFNAADGGETWVFDTESRTIGYDSGMTSSPAAYLDNIIVAASNGKVFSINASDGGGKELFDVGAKIYSSSPAIYDGVIYIGDESGRVLAYGAESGEEIWHEGVKVGEGMVRASPLVDTARGKVIVTSTGDDGAISALDMAGKIIWQTNIGGSTASVAMAPNGYVAVTASSLVMVDFDGEDLWTRSLEGQAGGAPTVLGDKIFTVTNEKSSRLISLDMNGTLIDEVVLEPSEYALCSPTFIDGLLFVTSNNGYVYAFSVVEDIRNDENGNLWLLLGGLVAVVLIAAIGLVYWNGKRKGE